MKRDLKQIEWKNEHQRLNFSITMQIIMYDYTAQSQKYLLRLAYQAITAYNMIIHGQNTEKCINLWGNNQLFIKKK